MTNSPKKIPAHLFVPSTTDMFISSGVLMWFLLLPSLVRIGFGVFGCRIIGEPVASKPTYFWWTWTKNCSGQRHMVFAGVVSVPMLLLYAVIVPVAIVLRLRRGGRLHAWSTPA